MKMSHSGPLKLSSSHFKMEGSFDSMVKRRAATARCLLTDFAPGLCQNKPKGGGRGGLEPSQCLVHHRYKKTTEEASAAVMWPRHISFNEQVINGNRLDGVKANNYSN